MKGLLIQGDNYWCRFFIGGNYEISFKHISELLTGQVHTIKGRPFMISPRLENGHIEVTGQRAVDLLKFLGERR